MAPISTEKGRRDAAVQDAAPIRNALAKYRENRIVSFDVPGHKQGKGNPALRDFLGNDCLSVDVNSMKPLDNLCHPTSVIREAELLAASAFGADAAFFMVGGTTSSVQAMILSVCRRGEKIIMPRNVHRSAINALILGGAIPVYVNPGLHPGLGIPLGMDVRELEEAIRWNPDAKAVFINNPTYYGICGDLPAIVKAAHKNNMTVLVDEAHGTHFYFGGGLPVGAMEAGADMAAVSVHKTGGSLTQSSLLLMRGERVKPDYVRTVVNLTQTTSGSYLLLSSLDIARRELALRGREILEEVVSLAEYARGEINALGGYYAFSRELVNGRDICDFDVTKLSIHTLDIGLAGVEVYGLLRDRYGIQIELGDMGNILAVLSVGDNRYNVERLVASLSEIKRLYQKDKAGMLDYEYINPVVEISPQEAFYADSRPVPVSQSEGEISGEFIMCYPPGIPILAPGERITREAVDYILYAKEKGSQLTGTRDMEINRIQVLTAASDCSGGGESN